MSRIEFYNYVKGKKEHVQRTKTLEKYNWATKDNDNEVEEAREERTVRIKRL